MTSPGTPFSLRPWPIGDKKPKNLGEFIARVNAECGGFRNVTEAKLREEIAAGEIGTIDTQEPEEEDEEDEEEVDTDKTKYAVGAREEFLKNIEFAHQSAMLALDCVSLLCSKHKPQDAVSTLSTALRERVGLGTLGASRVSETNITETRQQDDLVVSTGWRLMGVNNMVDSVVAAAEKLEKEIELETKYWDAILSVSERGWAVCSMPQEPHTLGVMFGFAESNPEFRKWSLAPLRRNDDGTVRMDLGRVGKGSQRVRVTTKKNGIIVDQSPLPGRISDDAPLPDRVLEARNTAFHQELWYEINREARTLLSSSVYSNSSNVTWQQDEETDVIFTLEDLSEPDNLNERISVVDCACTTHYVYMQFLLYQGHRQNYHRRRTMAQIPSSRVAMHQPYAILRAVIAHSEYTKNCKTMADFLENLVSLLQRVGISTATCRSASQPLPPALLHNTSTRRNQKMELNFINHLVGRLESTFELTITPETRLFVRSRIVIVPYIGTVFGVSLTPFTFQINGNENKNLNNTYQGTNGANNGVSNPLETSYPPSDPTRDPYPNAKEAAYYIRQAAARAVVTKVIEEISEQLDRDDISWAETVNGPGISDRDDKEARIEITEDQDGRLMLSLHAQWLAGKDIVSRTWTWRADRQGSGDASGESLSALVLKVMQKSSTIEGINVVAT
ncbi:subunit 17 of mediator complex-domain-containing protein [Hypoxylon trugodes]|uniref:subunit 17 of mediator complex-domain-containing protein n=1 Tax=Hypoxylon trugodes TaxID=326681 RepID=UPI00219C2E65|nr:subunit 17 of mediator complex-domain-containing protein [Hypoxylon trugodes]KAI1392537.1 subunit 17 of mediator complex-domain-containing protein [Hypoxylon trugodes]